jgi:hypothetical protein
MPTGTAAAQFMLTASLIQIDMNLICRHSTMENLLCPNTSMRKLPMNAHEPQMMMTGQGVISTMMAIMADMTGLSKGRRRWDRKGRWRPSWNVSISTVN